MGVDVVIYVEAPEGWELATDELGEWTRIDRVPVTSTYPHSQAYPAGVTHNIRTLDRYFGEHERDPRNAWKWPQIRRKLEILQASGVTRIWYSADIHDVVDTRDFPEPAGSNSYLLTSEKLAQLDERHAALALHAPA